jgi:hypothetical protein
MHTVVVLTDCMPHALKPNAMHCVRCIVCLLYMMMACARILCMPHGTRSLALTCAQRLRRHVGRAGMAACAACHSTAVCNAAAQAVGSRCLSTANTARQHGQLLLLPLLLLLLAVAVALAAGGVHAAGGLCSARPSALERVCMQQTSRQQPEQGWWDALSARGAAHVGPPPAL